MEALAHAQMLTWANPSSPHATGIEAKKVLERAKRDIAVCLGCRSNEIVFTSGATEANNLAIKGIFEAEQLRPKPRTKILVSSIEHPSVLEAAEALIASGATVEQVSVDQYGRVDMNSFWSLLSEDTLLVSVMAANNEIGTIQPIREISIACKETGVLVHTDATQWVGRLPVNVKEWGIDMLSASAHKLHGPKGIGLLFVGTGVPLARQQQGGGQQGGRRSGTIDVPGAVAFARALTLATEASDWEKVRWLRERLLTGLQSKSARVERVSPEYECLPNTLNVRFKGVDAEALMNYASLVCCSPGSACAQGTPGPSHVLRAIGMDPSAARECIRLSLSQETTLEEIEMAIATLSEASSAILAEMEAAA